MPHRSHNPKVAGSNPAPHQRIRGLALSTKKTELLHGSAAVDVESGEGQAPRCRDRDRLPALHTYENLVQRTMVSFGLLGFGVYFVNDNGSVDLVLPHRPVGDEVAEPAAMTALPEVGEARGAAVGREATCRAEILDAFDRLERRHGRAVFAPVEIIQEVLAVTDRYPEHTIRTEIVSRMCAEAPVHHAASYNDLERVGRGRYRVRR